MLLDAATLLKARAALLQLAGRSKPDPTQPFGSPLKVLDLSTPCGHVRTPRLAPTGQPVALVESLCARPQILEKIDLLAGDADQRLMRYAVAAPERG